MGGLEIRRRRLQSVQEALRILAPEMIGVESAQAGSRGAIRSRRSVTVAGPTEPLVVVDGVRILHRPEDALAGINIDEVDEIRVSKGTAGGWRYGLQGVDGVISITTRTGVANALALGPRPEECGFRFSDPGSGAPPATRAGGGS
jgi:outer membrane cobalamin receptor